MCDLGPALDGSEPQHPHLERSLGLSQVFCEHHVGPAVGTKAEPEYREDMLGFPTGGGGTS